ncbi:MAG: hypothetical protein ACXVPU_19745 [Bacteroidia bacterium]
MRTKNLIALAIITCGISLITSCSQETSSGEINNTNTLTDSTTSRHPAQDSVRNTTIPDSTR